jgi:hypothetical protein
MTMATATAFSTAAAQRRVLATLSVDVENQDTGTTSTTVIGLHDGETPAVVAAAFCASVEPPSAGCDAAVADALQQRFQERIDHDMQFFFHVNSVDGVGGASAPFLFFRGDDVDEAVASYLHAYGAATQNNFDMLVQASHAKLLEEEEAPPMPPSSSTPENTGDDQENSIEVFVPPMAAGKHCRAATYTFGDFVECVRDLRHGHHALQVWMPPVLKKTTVTATMTATTATTAATESNQDVAMFVMSAFIFICCCVAAGIMWKKTAEEELDDMADGFHQVVTAEAVTGFVEQAKENITVSIESSKKPRRRSRRRFGTSINNAL